jgi:NAD(P)-dependent dehydrogenase (short-subunit alcohol dehydrogenase family)
MTATKTVLITGASSGIGLETARLLLSKGLQVFGTTRGNDLTPPVPDLTMIKLDVTDGASVTQAVRIVLERTGQIDGLVNNAGYMLIGGLEETSIDEARQQFDANVFGVMRVTNAVLPTMRERGGGRIVNIGSVLGFLPGPYLGVYTAGKHAIAGYTETLDHEVRQFGIRAILVEPSFTKSNLSHHGKAAAASIAAYAGPRARATAFIEQSIAGGGELRAVADVIHQALTATSPRQRYQVGEAVTLRQLRRFVPAGMFASSIRKRYRLDEAT